MIAIIDYGLGNVQAFLNVFRRLNIEARTASSVDELRGASRLLLPGVGAFDHAMSRLNASGLRDEVERLVLDDHVPILGVCVGMQMLATDSEEGVQPGLGWVAGRVRRIPVKGTSYPIRLPHMGWNDVVPTPSQELFSGLGVDARFYFLHSYYFECAAQTEVAAVVTYGEEFCCSVRRAHIHGVQFHPEKSHRFGTRLLANFARS